MLPEAGIAGAAPGQPGLSRMIHYNIWFRLRDEIDEGQGLAIVQSLLAQHKAAGTIAGFHLLRNSGSGSRTRMPAFQALIEFRDEAQFSATFAEQAQRGIRAGLHGQVMALVSEFQVEVFRQVADGKPSTEAGRDAIAADMARDLGFNVQNRSAQDLHIMRQMLNVFAEVFADPVSYAANPPSDEYLRAQLQRDTFIALAAVSGGAVIGGLAAYILPKIEQARSEAYIYDLAVSEPYRRRGVATALIEALKTSVRDRGVQVIFVQADHGDDAAVALYSKLGRREDVMHFDITV